MEVKEILQKALEFYEDHDWIQDQLFSRAHSGPAKGYVITGACLEGSCLYAQGLRSELGLPAGYLGLDALAVLRDAAYELFPERFPVGLPAAAYKFNDHELTTREDALLVIKHAISKEENGSHDREEPAG